MVQENFSSLISDRRRNPQKHGAAAFDFRADETNQGIPGKKARRVDNIELQSNLQKARRNLPALSSNDGDENAAPIGAPIVTEVSHSSPAAMPSGANRRPGFIDFAPHIFRTMLAQHIGEFFQFRHVDFQSLAANRTAAAFAARN